MRTNLIWHELPVEADTSTPTINVEGSQRLCVQLAGTFVASYVIEGSLDGVAWYDFTTSLFSNSLTSPASPLTAPGFYFFSHLSVPTKIRVRCTAYTSSQSDAKAWFAVDASQ